MSFCILEVFVICPIAWTALMYCASLSQREMNFTRFKILSSNSKKKMSVIQLGCKSAGHLTGGV